MKIADRLRSIKPSATLAINAKALELKAKGVKITSLAIGEPDFPTPAHIREAAKAAIDEGFTRYTAVGGIPELRKAVGGYFQRQYGTEVPPEAVAVSNGGKHTLANILQCYLNPGDEVLIPAPYWLSYPDMVSLAGATPVTVPASVEDGFKITTAGLEARFTPKTRLLLLNSPSNPTGAVYTQAELDTLVQWALERDIFVLSDEIYDRLVYAPAVSASAVGWWLRYPDKVAIANGVAKTYAMTGWRVGYCVAHPDLVKGMVMLQGQTTSNVCSIAQRAALAALEGPQECVATMNAAFARRRDLACGIVSDWPGVVCPKPSGAFYLFVDVSRTFREGMRDITEMCTRLLEEAHVAVVPGTSFGDDKCLRLSYAVADDVLKDALERIGAVLRF